MKQLKVVKDKAIFKQWRENKPELKDYSYEDYYNVHRTEKNPKNC